MDESLAGELADLGAMLRLAPLLTDYLPTATTDLRPAALTAVLDEVLLGARVVTVQCGCGASSVLLARMLARRGFGHLLCLEHDERMAAFVGSQLRREGLGHVARVVYAPLAPHPAAPGGQPWYEPELVHDEVAGYVERFGLVDLLLVDGPGPADPNVPDGRHARYPALPVLRAVLSPGAAVFLDDVGRVGELAVLDQWEREFGLRFRSLPGTGLAAAHATP
ncbi:class I SAM-dependent methyltransferase [Goodfellowiella coeruleoviolacea]|uniref:Methyltransferase domain-containing protein n=1 Tax=Goodfellowiella coeruleoviolacea TaxID=334858 RepID=A0AAE3GE24_9PSEU|nr:class I SAM-dependent methyltransferase [Goodfellowiella coeruleoviolacea]MCP2164413.1 Methyltransferase domain-containing protein [Goodfellowiella coeruleoviolacea]